MYACVNIAHTYTELISIWHAHMCVYIYQRTSAGRGVTLESELNYACLCCKKHCKWTYDWKQALRQHTSHWSTYTVTERHI